MLARVTVTPLYLLFLCLAPAAYAEQAVTVLSGGAEARNCYLAARNAAKHQYLSAADLKTCDHALDNVRLTQRDRAGTHVNRAIVETALSRYRDAYADYNRALRMLPDLPEAYVGRGNIYFLSGKLDLAIADYSRALQLNIGRAYIAHLNRGMAYEKQGRFEVAEAEYRQALAAQPDWELAQQKLNRVMAKQAVRQR